MTDKLKQAAEKYATHNALRPRPEDEFFEVKDAFLAGASYQDPISRAEERAKIFGILMSEPPHTDSPSTCYLRSCADWLEKTLKAGE